MAQKDYTYRYGAACHVETMARLKRYCYATGESVNGVINNLIEQLLETKEAKDAMKKFDELGIDDSVLYKRTRNRRIKRDDYNPEPAVKA